MGLLNADWHRNNKMPKNPTNEERLQWHANHLKHCQCRKPTDKIMAELRRRKLAV